MTPLLLTLTASAGWTVSTTSNGCTFYVGERQGAYAPVRAECDWAIAPDTLHGLISQLTRHKDYFSSVSVSEKVSEGRYRQVHVASGIGDRELIVDMGSEPIPGGTRYWWKKSGDQAGVTGDNVMPNRNEGKWEVTAGADGGSHVVYELLYDPGGSVPGFLVRWFQTSGVELLVGELKKSAGG